MIDIRDQIAAAIASGIKAKAVLADPPWKFLHWGKKSVSGRDPENHYALLTLDEIKALRVAEMCDENTALFLWSTWPMLKFQLEVIEAWGFEYKTCGFDWMKANVGNAELFPEVDTKDVEMKLGYWTRSNSEPCLLATRGKPKRIDKGVRMGIIEPARQHSRKPDCVHGRIERLVDGPYLELFGRTERPGWTVLGNEVGKFRHG